MKLAGLVLTGTLAVIATVLMGVTQASAAPTARTGGSAPAPERLLISGAVGGSHLRWSTDTPPAALVAVPTDHPDDREILSELDGLDEVPSPSGDRIAATASDPLRGLRVTLTSVRSGLVEEVATLPDSDAGSVLDWAGDGSELLLSLRSGGTLGLTVLDLRTGTTSPVVGDVIADPRTARFDPTDATRVYSMAWPSSQPDLRNAVYRLSTRDEPVLVVEGYKHISVYDRSFESLEVSPDGSLLVVTENDRFEAGHVTILPLDGSAARELIRPSDNFTAASASFSRDGRWVYFTAGREHRRDVYRVAVRGGPVERLTRTRYFDELRVRPAPVRPVDRTAPHGLRAVPDGGKVRLSWLLPTTGRPGAAVLRRFRGIGTHGTGTQILVRHRASTTDHVVVGRTYTYRLVLRSGRRTTAPITATLVATRSPRLRAPALASDQGPTTKYQVSWTTPENRADTWYLFGTPDGGEPAWEGNTRTSLTLGGAFSAPAPGTRQRYRARAVDRFGNCTPWVHGRTVVPRDVSSTEVEAGWSAEQTSGAWLDTLVSTEVKGASLDLAFRVAARSAGARHRMWLVGETGPGHGELAVLLDGTQVARVDTGAARLRERARLWTASRRLSAGRHVLRVVALGTTGRPTVSLDAFGR